MTAPRKTRAASLWSNLFGKAMTRWLTLTFIPNLVWNQEIYGRIVAQYTTEATRWLDAGCGHQLLPAGLEDVQRTLVSKPRTIVGVDLDVAALRSHKNLSSAVASTLDQLPFRRESFDLVTCNMVAEHLENPAVVFRELAGVLRPGGVLIVHTPNLLNYAVSVGRALKAMLPRRAILALIRWSETRKAEDVFPTFYRANTRNKLRHLLSETGLSEQACHMLVGPQPICSFFAPVGLVELIIMRATMLRPLRPFATAILGVYGKPGEKRKAN